MPLDPVERMMNDVADFVEAQAGSVGISARSLSLDQEADARLLEWLSRDSTKEVAGDCAGLQRAVLRILLAARALKRTPAYVLSEGHPVPLQRSGGIQHLSLFYASWLIVLLGGVGAATFRDRHITVEPYTQTVVYASTSWWGLSRREREIRWMNIAGDRECWAAQKTDTNDWYCFIEEEWANDSR